MSQKRWRKREELGFEVLLSASHGWKTQSYNNCRWIQGSTPIEKGENIGGKWKARD